MLLHIRPRLLLLAFGTGELVDLTIEPFGLHLRGGVDLATGRPYPNKRFWVGCRKHPRRKMVDGLLLDVPGPVTEFSTVARWAVDAAELVTHRVTYRLLDQEFDTASDNQEFWYARLMSSGGFSSRLPDRPVTDPMMEVVDRPDKDEAEDLIDEQGFIRERRQLCELPTFERERMTRREINLPERLPSLDSAIQVGGGERRPAAG